MKKMKKLVSFLLAAVMILSMSVSVLAATVTNTTGHSYDAYQIFKGTQADGDAALGGVEWGTGIKGDEFLAALKVDVRFVKDGANVFASCENAAAVSTALAANETMAKAFANVADKHLTETKTAIAKDAASVDLSAGYYLMVDTETIADGANDAKNSALLQVTNEGTIEMQKKYSLPTSDKDITGVTHLGTKTNFTGAEAVDAEIGDTIEFTLTGTLPENFDDYETYYYAFHDTLSADLEYAAGSAKVYVGDTDITAKFTISTDSDAKGNLHITCADLTEVADVTASSTIKVVYSATLKGSVVVGSAGNSNEMYIEYSNNPNHDGAGKTGNTEKDTVVVFTYELDVDKVDGGSSSKKLANAEFVLLNADKTKVATVVDGVLTGWETVPTADEDGNLTWPADTTLKSDANGQFIVKGLDSATYFLKETKAPAGYNLLTDDVQLVITATVTPADGTEGAASLDALKIKVDTQAEADGNKETGIVVATIANNKGSVLPETGGMGTTIFYVIGAVLVLGAGILLVTRRRMDKEA